jgi:hypothetical protein
MRRGVFVVVIAACGPPPEPLLAIRGDVAAMRAHAWQTWAAVAGDRPAWDAWTPSEQLFAGAPAGARPRLRTPRPFRAGKDLEAETLPVMFDVLFDPHAAAHVRAHRLGERDVLAHLPAVPAFPRDAITIKLVWFAVHATGLTPMPIWDGEPVLADADGNPDRSWRRWIAVDPARASVPDDETAPVAGRRAHVVPLAAFIHRALDTDDEVASARTAARDPELVRGDFVALVAAHVSTKEIPDWTWETFWWHDRPGDGAFAAGRPDDVRAAAGHYLMDVTFGSDTPCMNPWLEARFPDGLGSNCASCHQRAVVRATDYLPVTHGRMRASDPYFAGRPQTDFVWSVALEAR